MAPSLRTPTRPSPLQLNNGSFAPILLGKGSAKQYMSLPQDEDNLAANTAADESNPAVARAIAQARAKRGPVVLIQRRDDSDYSMSSEDDSEEDSDDSAPGLVVDNSNSSSSSGSEDSDSDSDQEQVRSGLIKRRPFSTLRKAAASAPAHQTRFNQFVIADSDDSSADSSEDEEPQQPMTARRTKTNVDYVKQYQSVVVKDDRRVAPKPATPKTAVMPQSSGQRGSRSSTFLSRREAAIEWIKSQLVPTSTAAAPAAPAKTVTVQESSDASSSSEDESDSNMPTSTSTSSSSSRRVMLSSMSEEEQKRALQARASNVRPSLSERRASGAKLAAPKRIPTLGQLSGHNSLGHDLKVAAAENSPTTVTRIAPSPGTPSLGWAQTIKSMPAPTPREPFVARCGGIEIRITPPTPRPLGFTAKISGVTLRHTFAPPPGSVAWTPNSPRMFGQDEALSPPPFDVAPGRNIIMQRRAEQQLQQLKMMAEQQIKTQNGMTFASSPTSVNSPTPSSRKVQLSPRGTPDTPLPPRASATVAQMQNRRQAATLQTAIASPQAPRAKPIYIPPGQNGFRSGQLKRPTAAAAPTTVNIEAPRSAVLPARNNASATTSSGESKREAGRVMLSRLGQRSGMPQSAVV